MTSFRSLPFILKFVFFKLDKGIFNFTALSAHYRKELLCEDIIEPAQLSDLDLCPVPIQYKSWYGPSPWQLG